VKGNFLRFYRRTTAAVKDVNKKETDFDWNNIYRFMLCNVLFLKTKLETHLFKTETSLPNLNTECKSKIALLLKAKKGRSNFSCQWLSKDKRFFLSSKMEFVALFIGVLWRSDRLTKTIIFRKVRFLSPILSNRNAT